MPNLPNRSTRKRGSSAAQLLGADTEAEVLGKIGIDGVTGRRWLWLRGNAIGRWAATRQARASCG